MEFESRPGVERAGPNRWLVTSPHLGRVFVARSLDGGADWQAFEVNGDTLPVRSADVDEVIEFLLSECP